jgi:hypothetical protein
MNIFISYSRYDRPIAERIDNALNAAGFETFLDTKNLPIGQEFNARIKLAIDSADLFLFLASSNSVRPGSYTLTELSFAENKWQNPSGYVLPILLEGFDPGQLPAYIRPVNGLQIKGNAEAEVVGWVIERASSGTVGAPGVLTPQDRLKRWARLAQPPLRKGRRVMLWRNCFGIFVGGLITIGAGFLAYMAISESGFLLFAVIPTIVFLGGVFVVFGSIWGIGQGLIGGAAPVAAIILDRETRDVGTRIHIQTLDGRKLKLSPITKSAQETYPGELGWAYIRGKMLMEFIPANNKKSQSEN